MEMKGGEKVKGDEGRRKMTGVRGYEDERSEGNGDEWALGVREMKGARAKRTRGVRGLRGEGDEGELAGGTYNV